MAQGFGKTLNFKLVLLGDAAVGKSSCVERFVKNEFFEAQMSTIGGMPASAVVGITLSNSPCDSCCIATWF